MSQNKLDDKIIDLEARLSFQEDLIAKLDDTIARQDANILDMQKQLRHIYKKTNESTRSWDEPSSDLNTQETPPHY